MRQEGTTPAGAGLPPVEVPGFMAEVLGAFTRALRAAPEVNQRSGVSVRFSIGNFETLGASALRRAVRTGEERAVARPSDLAQVLSACLGKVEFESYEEGREAAILERLLRRSLLEVFRRRASGVDLDALVAKFEEGVAVETGDLLPAGELLGQFDEVPGLGRLLAALDAESESPALAASALEFALEGLHLSRRLDRVDLGPGLFRYGAA